MFHFLYHLFIELFVSEIYISGSSQTSLEILSFS
nr:MAG TPA: hypothetical protein [Caudoviricetes sp.]